MPRARRRLPRAPRQAREDAHVSDGRLAIFDAFVARVEPVTEIALTEHIPVDTTFAIDDNVRTLAATLDAWPAGFTG